MTNPPEAAASARYDRAASHVRYLRLFFENEGIGKSGPTRARYRRVGDQLAYFLDEADVASSLGTGPAEQLARERQHDKSSAFFRVFGMDELVCCLPHFVEPEWLLPLKPDARAQISLVDRLLRQLSRDRLIDMQIVACAWYEAGDAVRQARARMRPGASTVGSPPQLRLIQGRSD